MVILFDFIVLMSPCALDGVKSVEIVLYRGTREPLNCSEFNLQIHGIDSVHVDDDYHRDRVCSHQVFFQKSLSGSEIAGIAIIDAG